MHIAFIGMGGMGQPMALNLLAAGHELAVWNRSKEPTQEPVARGARACRAPDDVGTADVLISMLADDDVTHSVVVESGALAALKSGAVWINMATVSVAFTQRMAQLCSDRQLRYVAAPVLGRVDVAAAGQLNILAAGEEATLDEVQPLFDVLGKQTWRFGELPEQAAAVKLAANFMLASAIETMGESAALVEAWGVGKGEFLNMMTSTLFSAPAYKNYGAMIAEDRYQPAGFTMKLGLKDVRLAQQAAESRNVPMGIAGVLRDSYLDALAHGDEKLDWAALATVSARRSGQKK
ncbi:NAD(P)-dependent oxidoreductase [Jejubacter calystegiae]|uniref:NAD(P)-dependent oxidoreductase n=1 Tax=Jejubacter calystegiae TaxID=2579935 RepID=A0A4P8YRP9_9ENTR|nr:NAD(P)-dependent oxidoreductase [Jejubacter calystegiae]QCT21412.1 NAD(P)-dependent oxidoreductase [Jejubacter calystegiae]